MLSMVRLLTAIALTTAVGFGVIAVTPDKATAGDCVFVAADFTGPGDVACLNSSCYAGWCCQLCDPIEP